jgi:hypothetical protein
MALALVAGGVALWAAPGQRAARPAVHEAAVARPAAPAPAVVAARSAPPAPAPAAAPAPTVLPPPKPPATQALAPVAAPLPPVRAAEAETEPMSSELQASLDQWLISTYRHCWKSPAAAADSDPYFPKIRVAFKTDGALASAPRLVNPPSDPASRPLADAALRAVKACDPLKVPDKYAPYYRQWKTKTVYFDGARS